MAMRSLLEDFSGHPGRGKSITVEELPDDLEDRLLGSFENGYKAGWDDCIDANRKEQAHIAEGFGKNLQELSFTYHEVRGQVLRSMEPLLRELAETILPSAVHRTLGERIIEESLKMSEQHSEVPIEISIHPSNRPSLSALLSQDTSMPISIVEKDNLGEGQVFIRVGQIEEKIDTEEILGTLRSAVESFFNEEEELRDVG